MYSGAARTEAPESYGDMYAQLLHDQRTKPVESGDGSSSKEEIDETREYRLNLLIHLPNSTFFITTTGFYGIGPTSIEVGDQLAIWFGAPVPFILQELALQHSGEDLDLDLDLNSHLHLHFHLHFHLHLHLHLHSDWDADADVNTKAEKENNAQKVFAREPESDIFSAIGIAYVAGLMDGELADQVYCEDLEDDVMFTIR